MRVAVGVEKEERCWRVARKHVAFRLYNWGRKDARLTKSREGTIALPPLTVAELVDTTDISADAATLANAQVCPAVCS